MSKYGNTKCAFDGEIFDSKRERDRYKELRLMEKARQIFDLRRQVPFDLIPAKRKLNGKCERSVKYIADFVYFKDGKEVVEDSKGIRTKDYIIKRKLMFFKYDIEILET